MGGEEGPPIDTLTDAIFQLRWVKIGSHRGFYKRPTKTHVQILAALGIGFASRKCPSLERK